MTTENPNFVLRHLPVLGGLSGVAAFCTIFWSYALLPSRVTATASLQAADIAALKAALASVVTLPAGKTLDEAIAVNLTIQPTGTGVLNVRFIK
jgi:hypothetical protein